MKLRQVLLFVSLMTMLAACATAPPGPNVMVLPSSGKSFDQFRADDYACRQWALQQAGMVRGRAPQHNIADGAIIGTLVGAGLGAAIGSAYGNADTGAAIGAGIGLLEGASIASGAACAAGAEAQRRYDMAYQQCMYAKGNQIPGSVRSSPRRFHTPPPPPPPEFGSRWVPY